MEKREFIAWMRKAVENIEGQSLNWWDERIDFLDNLKMVLDEMEECDK